MFTAGLDIDGMWFVFPCPVCGLENDCRIQDVILGEFVLCRGCHQTIQLVDHQASTFLAERRIDNALQDLNRTFKRLK